MIFPQGSSPGQKTAISRLFRLIFASSAARVGETTVLSTFIHVQDTSRPHEVHAVASSDSGQVFYGRGQPGQILHADVFHSPGYVNPRYVARTLMSALSGVRFGPASDRSSASLKLLFSYMDVQTALGGGRLDGDLNYGQEEGVRKAHTTHVHLAMLNTPEILASAFTIVAAVESAIEDAGLELRKVQKIRMVKGTSPVDIGDYIATSDSLLRESPGGHGDKRETDASVYRKEALARRAASDIGSAHEAMRILEGLARGLRAGELGKLNPGSRRTGEEFRQSLVRAKLAGFDGSKYTLTEEGSLALSFLREHSREIEAYLRRLLWSLPSRNMPQAKKKGRKAKPGQTRGRSLVYPRQKGDTPVEVAVAQTCLARAVRLHGHQRTPPLHPATFIPEDLRFSYVREKQGCPIILLIDASASMTGRRISAAKELARHLVVTSKERVAVIAFQDAEAAMACGFTRNINVLEAKLRNIQAMGLTPLARGIEAAIEMASGCLRKPLVLLITDGIPTVPSKTFSPVDDALDAAKDLAREGIRLGCIGLEPNQSFLAQLVLAAKGTLYVVNELEASTLAAIVRKERLQ